MINVPENGQEGGQGQGRANAVFSLFRSSFAKGGGHEVGKARVKLCSSRFLGNGMLWRFSLVSLVSLEAENMIDVPENGQEGGQGQVNAKAILSLFCSSFAKGGSV